jgi:KDO2-lipid IV(A) lauroyltransferase
MEKIQYILVYGLCYSISLLPFCVLYCLSDFIYLIIYKVVGYRKKVVRRNIASSFPEKTTAEHREIERRFYHWLCDYFVESLKLLSISRKELDRRFIITNPELITDTFEGGQSVAAILGHYCNWEWLTCVGKDFNNPKYKVGLVYHPLYNHAMDEVFRKLRSHVGGVPIPKQDTLRYLLNYKREGIYSIFGYISDQAPKWENIHLWLPFLHHDTPVFTGGERIMRKMNNAVVYVEMTRPKRGYYTCTYRLITKDPNSMPDYEVTKIFFGMLEETIKKKPEYYLWSHNRWGRTHEEYNRRFGDRNDKYAAGIG